MTIANDVLITLAMANLEAHPRDIAAMTAFEAEIHVEYALNEVHPDVRWDEDDQEFMGTGAAFQQIHEVLEYILPRVRG